jgi:hypothetical protein
LVFFWDFVGDCALTGILEGLKVSSLRILVDEIFLSSPFGMLTTAGTLILLYLV